MKFKNVYWSKEALDMDHTIASVLAVGGWRQRFEKIAQQRWQPVLAGLGLY